MITRNIACGCQRFRVSPQVSGEERHRLFGLWGIDIAKLPDGGQAIVQEVGLNLGQPDGCLLYTSCRLVLHPIPDRDVVPAYMFGILRAESGEVGGEVLPETAVKRRFASKQARCRRRKFGIEAEDVYKRQSGRLAKSMPALRIR